MKAPTRALRTMAYLLFVLLISAALAACGGSGGGSTSSSSPGVSGPASVRVSILSAPSYPAGTTFASSTLSPATAAPPANSPTFDNVFVTVTKLALIPSTGPEFPDPNGETESSSADGGNGFVTESFSPVTIDLLHLTGDNAAMLLNQFSGVPAGEYSKIRVYYDNVVGQPGNKLFHPTAHYHFDVHFVGGNLVIPVTSDPQGGIRLYSVVIKLVGLKYHQAGNSGNILLRPQVFADFAPPIFYSVQGTADNVANNLPSDSVSGSFDVAFGTGTPVHVTFDNNTAWGYSDNVLYGSIWKILNVPNQDAVDAFKNRAEVKVIGWFDGVDFRGTEIMFTFPDVRQGTADNVWILGNTAFIIGPTDNVTVSPKPDRSVAYYDNLANPISWLSSDQAFFYTDIDNNLVIRARGYFADVENKNLDAYWISIGL